jgi:hypothetical protein
LIALASGTQKLADMSDTDENTDNNTDTNTDNGTDSHEDLSNGGKHGRK